MVATLELLKRANAANRNFVIVHEPTFYSSNSDEAQMPGNADDPMVRLKRELIESNGMVVWRFHDHWHAQRPDGIISGMANALGWEKYRNPDNPRLFALPRISLESLARDIRDRLKSAPFES